MPNVDLGIITVTGTQQRLTVNLADPTAPYCVHSFAVETWGATVGDGYVGRSGMDKSGGSAMPKLYGRIPKASSAVVNFRSWTCARPHEAFDLSHIYIDGDNVGDKFLITGILAIPPIPQDP